MAQWYEDPYSNRGHCSECNRRLPDHWNGKTCPTRVRTPFGIARHTCAARRKSRRQRIRRELRDGLQRRARALEDA